ncbi:MAG TPA: PAS domain-containing protein, partial [Oscillospiraceae bacterium]|nr:PAS domain-containing protein [Oscillospiraceae bacterium]
MSRVGKKDAPLGDGAVLERLSSNEVFGIFCIRLDDDLTVLYGNPLYYRLHGYACASDMERAVGKSAYRCIHPESLAPLRETLSGAAARGEKTASFQTRILRQDGKCRWVYCFAALEPDGSETLLYGCLLDVTEQKNREEDLRVRSEEFRLVAAQSGKYVMRYEIGTGKAFRYYSVGKVFGIPEENGDCPYCLMDSGAVAPESVEHYRAFFAAIRRGEPSGSCNLKLRCDGGELRWYRGDFTTIYGRTGAPQSAVVALFDNTEQREKELAYEKWQNTLSAMLAESAVYLEVNLTSDTVERRQCSAAYSAWDVPEHTLGAFVEYSARHLIAPDDVAAYRAFFDRDRLIALCLGGVHEDNLEFRVLGEENGTQWFRVNVQMVKYPYSSDVKAFLVFTDIDRRRRELDRLARLASCDALT